MNYKKKKEGKVSESVFNIISARKLNYEPLMNIIANTEHFYFHSISTLTQLRPTITYRLVWYSLCAR